MTLQTPVVFIIFRRPALTQQVFEQIAAAKPAQLFIIADGPRNPEEAELCKQARAVVEQIDWPCEVHRNYANENMGLRKRISGGLDWVFSQVERAIVLEDDCVPHPTFFPFCEELLEYYANDERVMHITGANFGFKRTTQTTPDSYYFTRYAHVWGWATWKRAWVQYDVDMKAWADQRVQQQVLQSLPWWIRNFWHTVLEQTYQGQITTWDYQWMFTVLANNGLAIMPYENTISNLGATPDSTHKFSRQSEMIARTLIPIQLPLRHSTVTCNIQALHHSAWTTFKESSRVIRYYRRFRNTFPRA